MVVITVSLTPFVFLPPSWHYCQYQGVLSTIGIIADMSTSLPTSASWHHYWHWSHIIIAAIGITVLASWYFCRHQHYTHALCHCMCRHHSVIASVSSIAGVMGSWVYRVDLVAYPVQYAHYVGET